MIKELNAAFALRPTAIGLCGTHNDETLRKFLIGDLTLMPDVRNMFQSGEYPHLIVFLTILGDPWEEKAAKDYWLGSGATTTRENLINEYRKGRLNPMLIEKIESLLPEKIPLTHMAQVVLIAAGGESEIRAAAIINGCMIAEAKIEKINEADKTALVTREIVMKQEKGYKITEKSQVVRVDDELTPGLKPDDVVAVHLEYVAIKLTEDEAEQLSYWNRRVVELI